MTEVNIDLKAKDQMSSVLDHVTQRLGIFSKAGIGMGIAFAGVNIAVGILQKAFSDVIQFVQEGVEANRKFEMSMARLSVSSTEFDVSMGSLKDTLKNFSVMFATDLSTLSDGLRSFMQQGYTASQSVTLLWHAERLAIASGNDLSTTIDVIDRAFNSFNLNASDASDVTKELNGIMSITGMTLEDIDIILGRVAIAAQKSGISFTDLINLMYTLHETGTSNRMLASELTKQLEDLSKVKIMPMPDSTATSIETKFKKISGTVQFTADMMKQLGTISQMDLTGGLDIGSMFDKQKIADAQKYFDILQKEGITSLDSFNSKLREGTIDWHNADYNIIGVEKQMLQLIRTYYQYNDMVAATTKNTETWQERLQGIRDEIDSLNAKLVTQNATLATTAQEIGDLTEMRTYTIDMRNATLAVQAQQAAIEQLQRISDSYNLSLMKNSLEIMKIQYNADARHGLNREQKEKIADLEKINAGIQIKEQENQIAISQIQQSSLQRTQDTLDGIRKNHDAAMYEQQIRDLDANIKTQNELYSSTLTAIATTNAEIAKQQKKWWQEQLLKMVHWAKEMHDQMNYAYSGAGTTAPSSNPAQTQATKKAEPNPPGWNSKIPFWKYQHGGLVAETAPALLHQGELVIPKDLVDAMKRNKPQPFPRMDMVREPTSPVIVNGGGGNSNVSQNVTIMIHADLHKDVDVEEWGKKLGAGLSSGFLSGSSSASSSVTSRKGGTVVVPGTTTAIARTGRVPGNSAVIQQPITNKSRFRIG